MLSTGLSVLIVFNRQYYFRFIIYKLPIIDDASSADMRRGLAYLYIDSNHNEKWILNNEININNSNCAVCRTIDQLYAMKSNPVCNQQ
jgi:hypothetical protein